MTDFDEHYTARDIITDILQKDLIGPVCNDEVLAESPIQYYIMGKLYPQKDNSDILDMAKTPLLENESGNFDAIISLSNIKNPSSMGITVALNPGITDIRIKTEYSFYKPFSFEDAQRNNVDVSKWDHIDDKPEKLWVRNEYNFYKTYKIEIDKIIKEEFEHNMEIHIFPHRYTRGGENIVTISIINNNPEGTDYTENAANTAFQVKLIASGSDDTSVFSAINNGENDISGLYDELDLLYSDYKCYAQGHGCSVQWDMENTEPLWISSNCFPSYTLMQMKAAEFKEFNIFYMDYLSKGDPNVIIDELKRYNNLYLEWIKNLEDSLIKLNETKQKLAENNIKKCKAVYNQIDKSIESLRKSLSGDGKAFRAFRLANEAMFLQRQRTIIRNKGKYDHEVDKIVWYPFQLSYFLHEIISFTDPQGSHRSNVDLLWFPTGGGKTEAYLGISAFVIFYRRLLNKSNDGVTVIMRYTLRLLTLQQFERASILIMACELLRREYNLGGSEFSIGLWVGNKLTPNSLKTAKTNINKLQRNAMNERDEENPCQIKICPWCGANITASDYSVRDDITRMVISCPNEECVFHSFPGLPMHIIDDAIYHYLPSFIIATIDKFAQIPLSDKPAALFGITNGKKPPELIIQDELHLISGPLGTMTGIYEVAVTNFCEYNNIPVKIIASTATIKNADRQILSLYGREYTQFPPQGISIDDSFFAVIDKNNEKAKRQYFGVLGIGTTTTTTLIRVNAALLFATRYLEQIGISEKVIDNYWTIIGYFNSLRELGGASTQIIDDVQSRFSYLAKTKFFSVYPGVNHEKKYDHKQELTSRMNNTDISKIIQEGLKKSYKKEDHIDVYDFVIASNMISVGIDIDRLGLMVVAGQPKTNSEYIQTTSRIGRRNPGLVITVFNGSRSRDRSHYEQFLKYHSAFYRFVEATSITPFSDRARDRGLHALFVALCRYKIDNMIKNSHAANFTTDNDAVNKIINIIVDYVKRTDILVDPDELQEEINEISREWEIKTTGGLVYKNYYNNDPVKELLKSDISTDRFRTMSSLRNVDPESGIYLLGGY
jgi:hypothetical protein